VEEASKTLEKENRQREKLRYRHRVPESQGASLTPLKRAKRRKKRSHKTSRITRLDTTQQLKRKSLNSEKFDLPGSRMGKFQGRGRDETEAKPFYREDQKISVF